MFELNPPLLAETPISKGFFLKDLKKVNFHRVPPMKKPKNFRPPSAAPQNEGREFFSMAARQRVKILCDNVFSRERVKFLVPL